MKLNETYAVVDLEATGNVINGQERIIQFSCVFVKNNKIINQFNTFINPEQKISKEVTALTHITNEDVKDAPLFEDVAKTIYALLQGTTFVAHNISFDYGFLNSELQRVGCPPLTIPGIDTVQLSQIIFPTLPSYRLTNLGESLGIENKNPHRADSDALVTAEILIKLFAELKTFPLPLLQTLSQHGEHLLYNSGEIFKKVLAIKQASKIDEDYIVIDGVVLPTPTKNLQAPKQTANSEYPFTMRAKNTLLKAKQPLLPSEMKLMNDIYQFFAKSQQKQLIVQPQLGMNKALSYLLPVSYLIKNDQKFVISLPTTAQQIQLKEELIPTLSANLPTLASEQISMICEAENYLDLAKFHKTLSEPQNMSSRVLQMRILVWLTKTKTGLFAELHLTKLHDALFKEIMHQGSASLNRKSPFYQYDFVRQAHQQLNQSQIIITNNHYLLTHVKELAKTANQLIVTQAPTLAAQALTDTKVAIDFDLIEILANNLLMRLQSNFQELFKELIEQGLLNVNEYQKLTKDVKQVIYLIQKVRQKYQKRFLKKPQIGQTETLISGPKFYGFLKNNLGGQQKLAQAINKFANLNQQLRQRQLKLQSKLTNKKLLKDYFRLAHQLQVKVQPYLELDLNYFEQVGDQQLIWLSEARQKERTHLILNFATLTGHGYLKQLLYRHFRHTLFLADNSFIGPVQNYLLNKLDLPSKTKVKNYPPVIDYQTQSECLVVTDAPNIKGLSDELYYDQVTDLLVPLLKQEQRQTLILFNSEEMIKAVYQRLLPYFEDEGREILAQGVTGSVSKLKKRFTLNPDKNTIILGANEFWYELDLPNDLLDLVIAVKLPFMSGDDSYQRVRNQMLKQAGHNSFNEFVLPEALMQFKAGFDRLLRTPTDHGLFVVLDPRLESKRYGKQFKAVLPAELPIKQVEQSTLLTAVSDFFKALSK